MPAVAFFAASETESAMLRQRLRELEARHCQPHLPPQSTGGGCDQSGRAHPRGGRGGGAALGARGARGCRAGQRRAATPAVVHQQLALRAERLGRQEEHGERRVLRPATWWSASRCRRTATSRCARRLAAPCSSCPFSRRRGACARGWSSGSAARLTHALTRASRSGWLLRAIPPPGPVRVTPCRSTCS